MVTFTSKLMTLCSHALIHCQFSKKLIFYNLILMTYCDCFSTGDTNADTLSFVGADKLCVDDKGEADDGTKCCCVYAEV